MTETVHVDRDGVVTHVALDRPEVLNAIDLTMLEALESVILDEEARGTRVVVIGGAERSAFSSGADLRVMVDLDVMDARTCAELAHRLFAHMERSPVVFITAIHGYALGGGLELALASDLRVAGQTARLGFPEAAIGAFPGWGGTQRLLRTIGPAAARRMLLTGDSLTADEARDLGLVHEVVPDEDVLERVEYLAARVSAHSRSAVAAAKRLLAEGQEMGASAALRHELEAWVAHFMVEDRREGMAAFLEKRSPQWRS